MENSCGRAARGDDVGRERFAFLCRMLLIVFQRARGLDEDWTSKAYNDFLAAAVNLWYRLVADRSNLRSKMECNAM